MLGIIKSYYGYIGIRFHNCNKEYDMLLCFTCRNIERKWNYLIAIKQKHQEA